MINFLRSKPLTYRLQQVRDLTKTDTAKNSLITFGGNFFNSALSMIAVILVSRLLGPRDFGVLAVFNTILYMVVGLTDLGLSTAAIKFISSYINVDKAKAATIMRVIFKIELCLGLLIAIVGLLFSTPIARLLGGDHLLMAVRLSFLASVFQSAAAFYGPFFVAYQQFVKNALVNTFGILVRVVGVVILIALSALNLNNTLWVYTLTPILFFIFGFIFVPKDFLRKAKPEEEKQAAKEIFHFSKWIFLSYIANTFAGRFDVLLISRYQGSAAVGLYAAALQLVTVMPLLIGAVSTVLLPKVSAMRTKAEFTGYIKKVLLGSILLTLALAPGLIFGDKIIGLIFGSRFSGSLDAFKLVFAGYLVALLVNPLGQVIYALNLPRAFTILNFCQLLIALPLNFILIPRFGIVGAATTFLIINIFGGVAGTTYLYRKLREMPE